MDSKSVDKGNNGFVGANLRSVQAVMNQRTLNNFLPFLRPILDDLPAGAIVLDVGCGPGSITNDIASDYPELTVVGLDISEESVRSAKQNAQSLDLHNVRHVVSDATGFSGLADSSDLAFLKNGCDLVYSCMVLMHVKHPQAMFEQMYTAAKPGGRVALKEFDNGMHVIYPTNDTLELWGQISPKLFAARGGDPYVGRKMISYALQAGFRRENIRFEIADWTISSPAERKDWAEFMGGVYRTERYIKPLLIEAGLPDTTEVHEIARSFDEWAAREDAFYTRPSPQIVCVKSRADGSKI